MCSEVTLSPSQQEVMDKFPIFLMDDNATDMIISGFAGSGKSFLVKYLADCVEDQMTIIRAIKPDAPRKRVLFAATTNKAASVLQQMTGKECRTIHKILGLVVKENKKNGTTTLEEVGQKTPLNHTVLFIDEASMIDYELKQKIQAGRAKYKDCKIIFIGDSYQLPPVFEAFSPVFRKGRKNNIYQLREMQRQAAHNPILQLAKGYREVIDDPTLPFPELPHDGNHIIVHQTNQSYLDAIQQSFLNPHKVDDCRILAWENKRVQEYNTWLRSLMGLPPKYKSGEVVLTNKPLMQRDAIYAQTDTLHTVRRVGPDTTHVKGILGYSVELENISAAFFQPHSWIDANNMFKQLAAKSRKQGDWSEFWRLKKEWVDLRPVHAITVHKSQGSTFREVFVDMGNIGNNTKWHEAARLAYVAISRASERVHILGNLKPRSVKKPFQPKMESFQNVQSFL